MIFNEIKKKLSEIYFANKDNEMYSNENLQFLTIFEKFVHITR
jgi:hypothetical protein